MNPYTEANQLKYSQFDVRLEMAKRELRTEFMRAKRAIAKWQPAPMPADWMRKPDGGAVWMDADQPVKLLRERSWIRT